LLFPSPFVHWSSLIPVVSSSNPASLEAPEARDVSLV
jgi:hypothetical protein